MLYLWLLANPDPNVRFGLWACKSPFEHSPPSPSCLCHVCPEWHQQCLCSFCSWADGGFVFWESFFPFLLSERCVALITLVPSLSCTQLCFKLPVTHSSWQELILGSSCSVNPKYRHLGSGARLVKRSTSHRCCPSPAFPFHSDSTPMWRMHLRSSLDWDFIHYWSSSSFPLQCF